MYMYSVVIYYMQFKKVYIDIVIQLIKVWNGDQMIELYNFVIEQIFFIYIVVD